MPNYLNIQNEETLKAQVFQDYFDKTKFSYEPNIDNIDFVIAQKKPQEELFSTDLQNLRPYFWAEAKKGTHNIFVMFTQLLLTCKKTYEKAEILAPPWLGVFDEAHITFISFHDVLSIFNETDFNWNTVPSNHESSDFKKAQEKVKKLINGKIITYNFSADDGEIKEFINTHFTDDAPTSIKSPITKDNFVQIFIKWVKEVKPFINIAKDEWAEFKQNGILDCDFYRADIMSSGGNTISERLKIILKNDNYKFQENISGRLFTSDIGFTDGGTAYSRFWNRYERPPALTFRQFIIDRRDLLVPQNIREIRGSFFTPKIWADKSKEYIAKVFGDNWQDEYAIWDCAAGTGNLLAGLKNKYNVYASDIDEGNVETIMSLIDIDENLDLLPAHVFKFDFLNDSFDKLPEGLQNIIKDPEKRKKLIVYINPPYAEDTTKFTISKTGKNKVNVARNKIHDKYAQHLKKANHELFAQFLIRIYYEIPDVKIANFSKLKSLQSSNFSNFRQKFKAKLEKIFLVPADTFDNVNGQFPIGFFVWNTEIKEIFEKITADIYSRNGDFIATKQLCANDDIQTINKWIKIFDNKKIEAIGYMGNPSPDFQHCSQLYISKKIGIEHFNFYFINNNNLTFACIYFAVRHCVIATWLNDRDQFLYPNDGWKSDIEFRHDCLAFTLFHGQNRISARHSTNHWIPFAEKEVDAKEKFGSNFMSDFLKGKIFTPEAQSVLDAGRDLWKYFHAKIKNNKTASVNASFYDIREFFQGRNAKGIMKTKSEDVTYNALLANLREKLGNLTENIQPKVYKYGFLK